MKKLLCIISLLAVSLTACSAEKPKPNTSLVTPGGNSSVTSSDTPSSDSGASVGSGSKEDPQPEKSDLVAAQGVKIQTDDPNMPTRVMENGTKINMHFGDTVIPGMLNDSETAKALIEMLPYTVDISCLSSDLCGVMQDRLPYNEDELHYGWLNGDIDYSVNAPYFTVLHSDEENSGSYYNRVNIGVITCELSRVRNLSGSYNVLIELAEDEAAPPDNTDTKPTVYFTSDISAEGLTEVYNALGWTPVGKVAVKVSTGEPPASNYLRPELIKDVVQSVNGTIVECNTAYSGSRDETSEHYKVAEEHGFTAIADFQLLDENGSMTLPVNGGSVLDKNYVGAAFDDYGSYLILSHFKGHAMAGYGGAIKNISIGLASSEGKSWIHSGGTRTSGFSGNQNAFLEAMAEAGKSVSDHLGNGERIVYVNVMNRLSIDCDCNGNPREPDIHDIGILASTDPVALDQACIDLIYEQKDGDGASFVNRVESLNGLHTLEHAEEIGLGSRDYTLADVDG